MNQRQPDTPFAKARQLERPPISEAIIELQLHLPDNRTPENLHSASRSFHEDYPIEQTREVKVFSSKTGGDDVSPTLKSESVYGYLRRNAEKSQVIQVMRDRFAYSRLRPYQGWENLRDQARTSWNIYQRQLHPLVVTRVALRYINRLLIPGPNIDFDDYLTTTPRVPPSLPPLLSSFMQRTILPNPDLQAAANVHLVFEGPERNNDNELASVSVILDIDVFRLGSFDPTGDKIWETLEHLRQFKNQVFFGSITEKTMELF